MTTAPVLFSSASPAWNTPPEIVALVVDVLGAIDLDPCSNSHEWPNVPAMTHFTAADNGLLLPWSGRVYMNPPYGRAIGAWVRRLWQSVATGDTCEAIALVPARTDTEWFGTLWDHADRLCFIRGRLRFSGHTNGAPFPSALAYFGKDSGRFADLTRPLGFIHRREGAR